MAASLWWHSTCLAMLSESLDFICSHWTQTRGAILAVSMGGIAFKVDAGSDATTAPCGNMTSSLFSTDAGVGLPALSDEASTLGAGSGVSLFCAIMLLSTLGSGLTCH